MPMKFDSLVRSEDAVLVIIDVQERLAAAMDQRDEVLAKCVMLAKAAVLAGMPIVVTRQYPKGLGETLPELQSVLLALASGGGRVQSVDKAAFCCAEEHAFMDALAATGRSQVVIAGMETHICVAQTALALHEMGRDVQVVADACCSRRPADHEIALDRSRAAGVSVTTTESVMYEAIGVAGTDEFKRLLAIVKGEA